MSTKLIVALAATLFLATSYASAAPARHSAHDGKWGQARNSFASGQLYYAGEGLFDRAKGHIE